MCCKGFMVHLPLDAGQSNAFDELLLGDGKYQNERQDADQSTGHQHREFAPHDQLLLEKGQPDSRDDKFRIVGMVSK